MVRCGLPLLATWGIKRSDPRTILMAVALERLESSLCSCGHSGFLTYDRHDNTPFFRLQSVVCVACEPREAAQRAQKDDPWPGTKSFVVNTMNEPEAV